MTRTCGEPLPEEGSHHKVEKIASMPWNTDNLPFSEDERAVLKEIDNENEESSIQILKINNEPIPKRFRSGGVTV